MADFIENCGVRGTSNCHKDEQIWAKLQVLPAQVILMKCNQEIVIILPLSREKGVILLICLLYSCRGRQSLHLRGPVVPFHSPSRK